MHQMLCMHILLRMVSVSDRSAIDSMGCAQMQSDTQLKFTDFTLWSSRASEFSHTVIHKAGVGLSKAPLPSGAAAAAAAAGRASPLVNACPSLCHSLHSTF